MRRSLILLPLLLALAACEQAAPATPVAAGPVPVAAPAAPAGPPAVTSWTPPVAAGAAQPDLVRAADGSMLLSWIEARGDGHALRLARQRDGRWSEPVTVAEGSDWFVNWADTPHVQATADGALWAHWLRKSAAATYAYDVVLARSGDGGRTWSEPVTVNTDGTPTEHGFVSMWPAGGDRLGIAWLDGRHTGGGQGGHDGHGGGMMTMRTVIFDGTLARHGEAELDGSTCDCCQTAVAATSRGPLVVYRDRTATEVRDIASRRLQAGAWTPARPVHADGWVMPACPVNGPSVVADGEDVVVGWYTAVGGEPAVRVAHSANAGDSFGAPLVLDTGKAVLGRVALVMRQGTPWALWMREEDGRQSLWLARLSKDASEVLERHRVAEVQGRGRGTGMPKMVANDDGLQLVWTDVIDGAPRLRGATIAAR